MSGFHLVVYGFDGLNVLFVFLKQLKGFFVRCWFYTGHLYCILYYIYCFGLTIYILSIRKYLCFFTQTPQFRCFLVSKVHFEDVVLKRVCVAPSQIHRVLRQKAHSHPLLCDNGWKDELQFHDSLV